MTTIFINGEDRTKQIKEWKLSRNNTLQEIELIWGKQRFPWHLCSIYPIEGLSGRLLIKNGKSEVQPIKRAQSVGNKYLLVTYENGQCYLVLAKKRAGGRSR
ncbi:hypothetical protein [Candidatus Pantoea persica]|uniref:hypothetical protein n=1 Tax=Candidatus Pantoea persica TaxID=2518128 RepID=UPI00215DA78A|nr:hypothetical protein [Candidatus Pantoea persica]MBA2814666.1 helicase [Candidatus Pantoea persica]